MRPRLPNRVIHVTGRVGLLILVLAAGSLLLAGKGAAKPGVTAANYDQIAVGMTYDEVVQFMGKKGAEGSRIEDLVTYTWQRHRLSPTPAIMIQFRNGRVVSKASIGSLN